MGRAKRLDREAVEWLKSKHGSATKRALRDGMVELVALGGRKTEQSGPRPLGPSGLSGIGRLLSISGPQQRKVALA